MLTYSTFSSKGDREINEDCFKCVEHNGRYCFVIADGLGGHGKGDEASNLVCDEIFKSFINYAGSINEFVGAAIDKAQNRLLDQQKEAHAKFQMKTTVVVLVIDKDVAYWGYVGDSRLYVFRKNKLKLRTLDHSVPQMLVLAKSIKESEIRYHPDRNKLLRVMGITWDTPLYESAFLKLKNKESFLLCTDGFWELINEKEMISFLKNSDNADQWLESMVREVARNGKDVDMDNYSAIAIMFK